jgi:hypothetical protein
MGIGPFDNWHSTTNKGIARCSFFVHGAIIWSESIDIGGAYATRIYGPWYSRMLKFADSVERYQEIKFDSTELKYWRDFQYDRITSSLGNEQLYYFDSCFLVTNKRLVTSNCLPNMTFLMEHIESVRYEWTNLMPKENGVVNRIYWMFAEPARNRMRLMIQYQGKEEEVWNQQGTPENHDLCRIHNAGWRIPRIADAISASLAARSSLSR